MDRRLRKKASGFVCAGDGGWGDVRPNGPTSAAPVPDLRGHDKAGRGTGCIKPPIVDTSD